MHDTADIQVATIIIFLFLSQIYILSNFHLGKQVFWRDEEYRAAVEPRVIFFAHMSK
jgi:hypothetical protein